VRSLLDTLQLQAAGIAKFYESMLGRKVLATPIATFALATPNAHVVSEYLNDLGGVDAATACDLRLACSAAAALTMIPAGVAQEAIRAGTLEGSLAENYRELANVGASLFNKAGRPHINLRRMTLPKAALSSDLVQALPSFKRLVLDVEIAGYPGGKIAFFYR
jgi:hypothetical protein